ncbi:uncharacterized protein BN478_00930 [Clostridium sp. CAG:1219]|nr:uncharacterized protein BN478_00930 [Clostridium sp. CAG:1219]
MLKKISYQISNLRSELKDTRKNQLDLDIMEITTKDAKNLRREIQINNEEIFKINFQITFFHKDLENLFTLVKDFQNRLYSKQIISNISNFRHLDFYLNSLPYINQNNKKKISSYITTSSLANIFPFYTKNILDRNGIVIGSTKYENKLCILDIFDEKYLNSNMCIFGSSGAGKSFFIKLFILKQYISGKRQVVFDPEGEYGNILQNLGAVYLFSNNNLTNYKNILDIDEIDVQNDKANFLSNKINQVLTLITRLLDTTSQAEEEKIKKAIYDSYLKFNITEDIESIYKKSTDENLYLNKTIIDKNEFPTLFDIYEQIKSQNLKKKFKDLILNKLKCFSKTTNIDDNISLIGIDLKSYDNKTSAILIRYFIERELKNMEENNYKNPTIIYIDEVWKYLKSSLKENISDLVFLMYKTIRKKNASMILITQEMSDLFLGENFDYAKSILNNSEFKMFFKMSYSDVELFKNIGEIEEEDIHNISKLQKGEGYLMFEENRVNIKIDSTEYEKKFIREGLYDSYSN